MRNLKRALSLALTAVMVLGMMVIGAGAVSYDDFSDKDKIVNTEAVSNLVELGVIAGKDDGSYDPAGIVTRAEMAKMICVVLNGGKDPQLGTVASYTYSDTVGHWAAAYIEYCTTLGIVAGDGTGKFNPSATVTGAQAAKMLLVAAGYQASIEGFTGANWATAVNVRANQVGLYDDLTINPSDGLSRDNAAQMVFNALNAKVVTYEYTLVTDGKGGVTSIPTLAYKNASGDKNITVLEDRFGVIRVEGIVLANEYAKLPTSNGKFAKGLDAGETQIDITNSDAIASGTFTSGNFKVSTDADMLGRAVVLFVKPSVNAPSNCSKGTVVGSAMLDTSNDQVVTDTSDDKLVDVLDDNDLDTDSATVTVSNVAVTDATTGIERTIIDNDGDGVANYVFYNTYYFGEVTKYSTKDDGSITVNTSAGKLVYDDKDDVVGFSDVAKDDYVIATEVGGKLYVSKAEAVTGNLTAYKSGSSLTVDGTKYTVGVSGAAVDTDEFTAPGSYGTSSTLNKDATFYLDNFGYVVAVGSVVGAADDYAFVWAIQAGDFSSNPQVKVTLSDGTTGVYTLTDKDGSIGETMSNSTTKYTTTKTAYGASAAGTDTAVSPVEKIYLYTINSDKEITLTEVAANKIYSGDTTFTFSKGKATIDGQTTLYGNTDTVFFNVTYKDNGSIKKVDVYTGISAAPSISMDTTIDNIMIRTSATGTTASAVVTMGATTSANGEYVYLYGYQGTNSDGAYYRGILDGVLMNNKDSHAFIYTDDDTSTYSGVYEYTMSSSGLYQIKDRPANYVTGFVTAKSGNSLIIDAIAGTGSTGEYVLNSDAAIATIDGGDTTVGDSVSKGDYVTLVYDLSGSDKNVSGAFIIESEDDANANILSTTLTKESNGNYSIVYSGSATVSAIKDQITASTGASVYVVSGAATTADVSAAAHAAGVQDVAVSAGNTYQIAIVSSDKSTISLYKIDITNP